MLKMESRHHLGNASLNTHEYSTKPRPGSLLQPYSSALPLIIALFAFFKLTRTDISIFEES